MSKPKILLYDIETAPTLAWIWRTGKQFVSHDQIKEGQKSGIICICYKWADQKTVHSLDWGIQKQNSEKMIESFGKILESADVAIAHNGDRFDLRQINTQRLLNEQPPIAWPTTEDTLKQFRKHFYLPSYSLDYLSKLLTGSGKDRMGFQDWIDIVEKKDPKALEKMIKYCQKDVLKLQEVWEKQARFSKPKIHAGIASGVGRDSCPRCASESYQRYGFSLRIAGKYQKYLCAQCRHVWTDSRRI